MSSTDASSSTSAERPELGVVDMKLEVVTLPVADADRAKSFYERLGWRLDADIVRGDNFRVVQFTPPHSACSVAFGTGVTTGQPGSVQRLILAVTDIDAARDALAEFAEPFTAAAVCQAMGVPRRDWPGVLEFSRVAFAVVPSPAAVSS